MKGQRKIKSSSRQAHQWVRVTEYEVDGEMARTAAAMGINKQRPNRKRAAGRAASYLRICSDLIL